MITKIHGLYVTLPIYIPMLLMVQLSMSIPRQINSATRYHFSTIVTENVANASLKPTDLQIVNGLNPGVSVVRIV